VDSQGRQHFNFPQRVWLYPSVPTAATAAMSIELDTLAINMLTPLTCQRDYRAAKGVIQACGEAGEAVVRAMSTNRSVADLGGATLNPGTTRTLPLTSQLESCQPRGSACYAHRSRR
jgi:hypothetical protein